jgi:hypothetical protein
MLRRQLGDFVRASDADSGAVTPFGRGSFVDGPNGQHAAEAHGKEAKGPVGAPAFARSSLWAAMAYEAPRYAMRVGPG